MSTILERPRRVSNPLLLDKLLCLVNGLHHYLGIQMALEGRLGMDCLES